MFRSSVRRILRPHGAAVAGSLVALAVALDAGPAPAAVRLPEDKSVTERPRPDLDPLGMRVGAFTINPKIEISAEYNDNIFAENTGEVDDLITVVHPSLAVKSDAANHSIRFHAGARIGRFADRGTEDFEDFDISVDGRIDVLRTTRVFGYMRYQALHEDRSSVDDANGKEPVEYDVASASLGGMHEFNRLSLRLVGRARHLDFDDARTAAGVAINQDDRDRDIFDVSLRAAYELVPEYEGFIRTTYNLRDYDVAPADNRFNRDSNGYEIVAGATADFTGVTFGEIFFGFLSQDYDGSRLNTVDGFSFGATVTWNPTPLTTVKGWARRLVKETTQVDVSGVLHGALGVSVDHELLRQLLLHAEFSYANEEFEGSTREDDLFLAALSVKYMLNRNYFLRADYRFRRRESTVATEEFDQNVFTVRFGAQF